MAKVKITHPDIKGDDAKVAPKREPVPEGKYAALITKAGVGTTKGDPPLVKVSVAFQLLHGITEENEHDETHSGRVVFQDYILEHDESMPSLSEQRRYELRGLLDATNVEVDDDDSFDPEHLKEKNVIITVRHRTGNQKDPDTGQFPVFSNVKKVDTAEAVNEEDLL